MSVITGDRFCRALAEAGVLPDADKAVRVVIDARPGHFLVMHVQYVADEQMLDVVPTLSGVEISRGGKMTE